MCTLLERVREQSTVSVRPETIEVLRNALSHQETRLTQLEQQRANIVSMLQRGKDILKDQHAPTFVSSEVQHLESSWNNTYGQSIEALKTLKSTQKLWSNYQQQKEEVLTLIEQAESELRNVESGYHDSSQVSTDLQSKHELSISLRKAAEEMLKKLRDVYSSLSEVAAPEKRPILEKEVTDIEKRLHVTLETVQERVVYLQQFNAKWTKFQARLGELQSWTQQSAPQLLSQIQEMSVSPEERVRKTEILQKQIHEKITVLKVLEDESLQLIKGECGFGIYSFPFSNNFMAYSSCISCLQMTRIISRRRGCGPRLKIFKKQLIH